MFADIRIREDLQDQADNSLIDPMGECTQPLINLIVFGSATPYLHNGVMCVDSEEGTVSTKIICPLCESRMLDLCNQSFKSLKRVEVEGLHVANAK